MSLMAKKKYSEIVKILKKLLAERKVHFSKIILFGSQVKDKPKKESDIDIIILSKDFENKDIFERVRLMSGVHREFVKTLMLPADIMYYSLSEWRRGSSLIIDMAKKEGLVYS